MEILAHITLGDVSFVAGVFLLGTLSGVGLGWTLWRGRSRRS